MKKFLKITLLASLAAMVALASAGHVEANDKLLEILKGKGILTDEQFEELQKESKKEVKAFYKDGFKMESGDKNFSLQVSGRVQGDFRYFDKNSANDTFDIRRAYLGASGTLYKYYDYKVEVDFAGTNGTASNMKDVYINYKYFPNAQIRIGQFYYPYGNELLGSDRFYIFTEAAAISTATAPQRDRGIAVLGNPFGGLLHYQVGIYNGNGENKAQGNDDFDYAARVVLNPTVGKEGPFQAWVGASFGWGQQAALSAGDIKIQTESKSGNSWFSNAATTCGFDRTRLGAEATLLYGPAMLKSEYLRTVYEFEKKADIEGYYVTASYMLTGEQKSVQNGLLQRQPIKKPFDIDKGQWGAWEVAARYSWFEVDDKFFETGGLYPSSTAVSKTTNANTGDSWTMALNWYLNPMTRVMADWVHSEASNDLSSGSSNIWTHDGGNKTDVEDAFNLRVGIDF